MKKLMMTGVASLMMVSAVVPAMTTPAEAGRGAGIVAGTIIGLSAAAIIANSSRAKPTSIAAGVSGATGGRSGAIAATTAPASRSMMNAAVNPG